MTKRTLSARLLLAVFLSLLLLSVLHVHHAVDVAGGSCQECVDHQRHDGHIGVAVAGMHGCVLCAMVSLPFVAAAVVAAVLCGRVAERLQRVRSAVLCGRAVAWCGLRGPPACRL